MYSIENFVSKNDKMNWKLLLVIRFTLLTDCSALNVKTQNYAIEKEKIIISNEILIGFATVFSDISCAHRCLGTPTCCSASYEIKAKKCLLNSCCNPEILPSENGIFIQKTGKFYFVLYLIPSLKVNLPFYHSSVYTLSMLSLFISNYIYNRSHRWCNIC